MQHRKWDRWREAERNVWNRLLLPSAFDEYFHRMALFLCFAGRTWHDSTIRCTYTENACMSTVCVHTGVRVVTNPMVYLEINMELNSKTNVDESTIYIYTVWSNNIISKRPELPAILHRYMEDMYIRCVLCSVYHTRCASILCCFSGPVLPFPYMK